MDESRARRADEIFAQASELDPDEQRQFVERECQGDEPLRREVAGLLTAARASERYFDELSERLGVAGLLTGDPDAIAGSARTGLRLGPYTLTEPIGRGGMGEVWRAERSDGLFESRVAIKLLHRAAGGAGHERFAREGRYLARLTHPNIARLLDAGIAPDNVPYLVLEHIQGVPIDRYCDEHRLSVHARIDLFLNALAAAAHAHAHLVVHRDIKPANVLVTNDGTVKLLDFGIAKLMIGDAVDDGTDLTRELGVALTPEFAAPEQLTGDAVTTAADVYSLGLVLYMLVSGHHPRQTQTIHSFADLREAALREPPALVAAMNAERADAARLLAVAERRSTTPADLMRTLRSDLDTIVRKALAVETGERYATVTELAADLRHYLNHEPVTAQPLTVGYRARKFVRRYRTGVIAAATILLTLVGSTAMTTWQSVEARRQRDAAVYQQQRVQAFNEFLNLLLSEIGPGGRPLTLVQLLDRGVDMLDRQYGTGQRYIGRMLLELANGYFSLGEDAKMLDLLGRAEQAARTNDDGDLLAAALCGAARLRYRQDPDTARAQVEEASRVLARVNEPSVDSFVSCARARAAIFATEGDRQRAIETLIEARASLTRAPAAGVENVLYVSNELSNLYFNERQFDKAAALNDTILRVMSESGRGGTIGFIVISLNRATLLQMMGEVMAAFEILAALRERTGEMESSGASTPGVLGAYASSLIRLARHDEAVPILEEQIARSLAAGNEGRTAGVRLLLGRSLARQERWAEAEAHLDSAEAHYLPAAPVNDRLLMQIAIIRASILLGRGDGDGARTAIEAALAKLGYPDEMGGPDLHYTLRVATEIALRTQNPRVAERYATDSHTAAVRAAGDPARSADVGDALLWRAKARLALGDTAAARADLERALPSLSNGLGAEHPATREARELLRNRRNSS